MGGVLWTTSVAAPTHTDANECVILVHGLVRSEASMAKMGAALSADGYRVVNLAYPSRTQPIEILATEYLGSAVDVCRDQGHTKIHFVTHSMGGILVRYYLAHHPVDELGRVVMLGPPNRGSELVDRFRDVPGFQALNGPAGNQLGTDDDSLPRRLGPVNYPVGVIAGNRSVNLFLSLFIPGADDGKVSVERAGLDGMTDFLVVPYTHPMIMKRTRVIRQTRYFLRHGRFAHNDERGFQV